MAQVPTDSEFQSSLGLKYPPNRDLFVTKIDTWFSDRKDTDGAEGLWRIHDELYDFSPWINIHPGGRDWLKMTKGTDITEAFECHHISSLAEELLPKYFIRKAKTPRNYPFTFHEDGFYKTLKRRTKKIMQNIPDSPRIQSKFYADILLVGYISFALLAAKFSSLTLGLIAGMLLAMLTISAHNFFHQKDNFRMFYFDFSLMSSKKWRVSHALSHHLYTNSIYDLELTTLEPFLSYLPKEKHIIRRLISIIISPGVYVFIFFIEYIERVTSRKDDKSFQIQKTDLLPFLIPFCMYLFGGKTLAFTMLIWLWIMACGSFHFGLVGLNAAHHHPNIFHDGDAVRPDQDWGLMQMDAVMDRREINKSQFLVITNFGDHSLHHLFPTLDHGHLHYLYPALEETCKEFNVKLRVVSQLDLIGGQFLQLMRVRPNPKIPGTKRKTDKKEKKTWRETWKPYINKKHD